MALVQQNGGTTNGSASIVTSLGSATTAGNTILIFANGAGTITTPSGFTSRSPQVNTQGLYLFEKLVASGNSSDTPTLTMSGAFNATWQIVEYSGITAFDVSSGNNSGYVGETSVTTPTLTPTSGERLLVAFVGLLNRTNTGTFAAGDPQSWTNSFTGERSDSIVGQAGTGRGSMVGGWADRSGVTGNGTTSYSTNASYTASDTAAPATIIASYKVTAGGGGATLAVTETPDVAAISGNAGSSGALASVDAADTASMSGNAGTGGALAATEAGDTASLSASFFIAGSLAATEAADTAAIAGSFAIVGSLASTEAKDVAALNGNAGVFGALAATETQDVASLTSSNAVTGTLVATEATDTASLAGNAGVSGSISVTEASDSASFSGGNSIVGILTANEATDTASFGGNAVVVGVLVATEAADTSSISADFEAVAAGSLVAVEAPDIASFVGSITGGIFIPSPRVCTVAPERRSVSAIYERRMVSALGETRKSYAGEDRRRVMVS
jgi:hypothetical protein